MVQLSRIPTLCSLGYFQYLVASIGKSCQSAINFTAQLWGDLKVAFNRYCLHLRLILFHQSCHITELGNLSDIESLKLLLHS